MNLRRIDVLYIVITVIILALFLHGRMLFAENEWLLYAEALDDILVHNGGPKGNDKLVIETETFTKLSDIQKEKVVDYFRDKYDVVVYDMTFSEIREQKIANSVDGLEGFILRMSDVEDYGFLYKMSCECIFGSLGAEGIEYNYIYFLGEWRLLFKDLKWVS